MKIKNVKLLRKKLGITQERFGEIIRVSRSVVCRYEKGSIKPSYHTAKRIVGLAAANGLEIDYETLLK